jgi:hypothetical protein
MHCNSYAQVLSAIGRDLEGLPVKKLDLELAESLFILRGQLAALESEPQANGPQHKAGLFSGLLKSKTIPPQPNANLQTIERRYRSADLERLVTATRSQPISDEQPDFYNLGTFLGVVGAYIDRRRARLLKLSKDDSQVTLHYETAHGEKITEDQSMSSFYDLFIYMYKHRRSAA